MKSLNTEQWVALAEKRHEGFYSYTNTVYKNARTKVAIECPIHGTFEQLPAAHLFGKGCRACGYEAQKLTTKTFIAAAKKRWGNKFDYSQTSIGDNNTSSVIIVCPEHGSFTQLPNNHLNSKHGCPKCSGKQTLTTEDWVAKHKATWNEKADLWDYSKTEYRASRETVTVNCLLHGDWTSLAGNFSQCPKCANETTALTHKEFVSKARLLHGDAYKYTDKYKRSKVKLTIHCKKHGPFSQRPNDHLNGNGCPECGKLLNSSMLEGKVRAWFSKHARLDSGKGILAGKDIDVFCPAHKLGIEVNGWYWHSHLYRPANYHYQKALLAKRKDLKLLQFWDWELSEKQPICKSMMLSAIGKSTTVYARKLTIKPVASNWFATNHLQGAGKALICYGLFDDADNCMCAMSFGKPRFNQSYEWEIVRFANALNTTVVGGASRLWAHFVRQHQPKTAISYADLRISQGKLYKQLGFKLSHVSPPSWYWCKNGMRLSRYQTQKHKLQDLDVAVDESKSAVANMRQNGWLQVFDAGTLAFIWKE